MTRPRTATPARVLTLLPDFPFPESTGLHLRMVGNLDLLRRLGCESHVLYFSTEGRPHDPADPRMLELCASSAHGGPRRPQSSFSAATLVRYKLDFLRNGVIGRPSHAYPFSMRYDAAGAEARTVEAAKQHNVAWVVLPSFCMHYATALVRAGFRVVADAADVLSHLTQTWVSQHAGEARGGRLGLYANFVACRAQERLFLPACSEVWATSTREAGTLSAVAAGANVIVVPNTIDERGIEPVASPGGQTVGFIGTYSYAPNLEAARFLAEQVLPLVLEKLPAARLLLAGAHMPDAGRGRLSGLPYVDFLGAVDQSRTLFEASTVVALPVFVRGGIPLKLVEAMARARPVVAHSALVAGLPVVDGEDVLVCDTAAQFAASIVRLLRQPAFAVHLATAGRATFLREWSRASVERSMRTNSFLAPRPADSA